jgi:DnaK suppressor protein
MPSKKLNKAAKKPGKAIPKKTAVRKTAIVAKKAARASPGLKHTSKVTVKPHKPTTKSSSAKQDPKHDAPSAASPARPKSQGTVPAKPAPAALTNGPAASAERAPPTVKFDSRPLLIPTRTPPSDEDGDAEQSGSASLLAGPRNVKPYIARRGEQYMSKEQLEHFARILQNWKRDLMVEVDRTVLHMKDEAANFPDPNDRATQ